jgi:hypothetical protein
MPLVFYSKPLALCELLPLELLWLPLEPLLQLHWPWLFLWLPLMQQTQHH